MNGRNLRLRRKTVCLRLAEDQEKCVRAAHRRFSGIVKLRVRITVLSQLLHALRSAGPQVIEPSEYDRFGRTNFRARWNEPALLAIVTKGAFKGAPGVGQRLRASVDHAERAGDDTITAAVANIVLNKHRANFGAHNRASGTGFEATGFLAVLANVGEKNPPERVITISST